MSNINNKYNIIRLKYSLNKFKIQNSKYTVQKDTIFAFSKFAGLIGSSSTSFLLTKL